MKFIFGLLIILYFIYQLSYFIMKSILGSRNSNTRRNKHFNSYQKTSKKRKVPGSNLSITKEPIPKNKKRAYKGGEYIKFEEIDNK